MRVITLLFAVLPACGAGGYDSLGGDTFGDGGTGCLSSNECPTGYTCSDFGKCQAPPSMGDGGVAPETEYQLGKPISSQRYVYVAMTGQDELARIDGNTLAVTSTAVGKSPRSPAAMAPWCSTRSTAPRRSCGRRRTATPSRCSRRCSTSTGSTSIRA